MHPRLRLGVLTNGDGGQQRAKLDRIGVLDRLDGVYVSSEISAAKPDPASFAIACRGLGLRPSEALFVGDLVEIDALPATAAGLMGLWPDRDGTEGEAPCPRITSLAEIPAMVRGPA